MKKVLTTLLLSLLAPSLALAAFNDAQLTTGTKFVLSVAGSNLEFDITSGNLESVTVNSANVVLVLATGGSGVTITSTDRRVMNSNGSAVTIETTCTAASSALSISGSGTITVTPTETVCSTSSSQEHGSGEPYSAPTPSPSSSGGGSSPAVTEPTPTPTPTPASTPAPVASIAQIVAPLVAKPSVVAQFVSPVFNKDLTMGSRGDDVKRLQALLAQDKDIYPNGLATGYFGKLTSDAIRKFQLKHGVIKKATDAGNGKLGPKTRAKLKEIFGKGVPVSTPAPAPVSNPAPAASTVSSTKSMQDQLNDLLKTLQELQAKAKKQ